MKNTDHANGTPGDTRSRSGVSRRDMLRLGGLGSVAAITSLVGCGDHSPPPAQSDKPGNPATAKRVRYFGKTPTNIILMVSDGMSAGVPTMAEPFAHLVRGRGTNWTQLMRDPEASHGQFETRSLNSRVTDSSAAASAWGSGSRVNNGALNMLPDATKLVPMATLLANHGKRVGLVTTDLVNGGTPSGFAAVSPSRNHYQDIAKQFQDSVDVLMGGGLRYFDPLAREDQLDLLGLYQKDQYSLVTDRQSVLGRPSGNQHRVLGLFNDAQMPYTIDHLNSAELRKSTPTLAEMTRFALRALDQKRQGFFCMIEGARIDHACHANDAAAVLWEQIAFDDAVGEAMSFIENRDDTLLIVTSDHGNANPGLCGMGGGYTESDACFEKLKGSKASFAAMHPALSQTAKSHEKGDLARMIKARCGVDLREDELIAVMDALVKDKLEGELWEQQRTWYGALSQALANHTGVSFNGRSHTSDQVMLTALGPGSEAFSGLHGHPELFRNVMEFYRIDHTNPSAEQPAEKLQTAAVAV